MNKFINMDVVDISGPLKARHFPFARGKELHDALSWCATDYFSKISSGKRDFEARGVLVTGLSRVGKTCEIRKILAQFNDGSVIMPDGRSAKIANCLLSGKVTWKDLGVKTLESLGYPMDNRRTQSYIWEKVIDQAARQGVIGIHFDECQHVFSADGGKTNRIFLDSFKTLLKDSRWPLILILSGIPELAGYVRQEEQLARLLRPVHFDLIKLPNDIEELNQIIHAFADRVGLSIEDLSTVDFLQRLNHACAMRWGLVIELTIEALVLCKTAGSKVVGIQHFADAFTNLYGMPNQLTPFTVEDYRGTFDPERLFSILQSVD